MSQPKRYNLAWTAKALDPEQGAWVEWDDYAALAAENEALVQQGIRDHGDWRSKLNFLETDYKAEVARLTAENERLRSSQLSLEKWIDCEQIHFETADNLREKLYQASVQIERLRKAGDAMYDFAVKDSMGIWVMPPFEHWSKEHHSKNTAKEGGAK